MKHCRVDLYKVCLFGDPRVQNGPVAGGFGFENEICLKSSPDLLSSSAWNFVALAGSL